MNLKRIGVAGLSLALAVACVSGSFAVAGASNTPVGPREILMEKLAKNDVELDKDELDALTGRFEAAFDSGDFSVLDFSDRAVAFDADSFAALLDKYGVEKEDKEALLEKQAKALKDVKFEAPVSAYEWVESSYFDDYIDSLHLTDEQKASLLEARVTFHDATMRDGYLKQLKLTDEEKAEVVEQFYKQYGAIKYTAALESTGYGKDDFLFDAVVAMVEAGDFDSLLKDRDKSGKLTGAQKVELAEMFASMMDIEVDTDAVYRGMDAKFAERAEK